MRNKLLSTLIIVSTIFSLPDSPSKLNYEQLDYTPPSLLSAKDTLSNGIVCFFVQDSTLPIFDIQIKIKGGSLAENSLEKGVSRVAFDLLSEGGVKGITADSLNEILEFNAISINSGSTSTDAEISASCISPKKELALNLLAKFVLTPSFDTKKLEITKANMVDAITSRFDSPKSVVTILQSYGFYGRNCYTELTTEKDIKTITKQKVIDFYGKLIQPKNIIIGVSGRFNRSNIKDTLEKLFGSIKAKDKKSTVYPIIAETPYKGFLFVDQKKLTQASIKWGLPTVQRPNDDYYPLTLMNWILGGAPFTSRISRKVREEEGLAYSAGSAISSEYFLKGFFTVSLETKSASAAYALKLIKAEIDTFLKNGPTEEEIASAKKGMVDGFPASFKSGVLTASAFVQNEFIGEAPDKYDLYKSRINKVTKSDIMRVAKNYLKLDQMALCIVGNFESCSKKDNSQNISLTDFGPIKKLTEQELSKLLGGE